MMGITNQVLQKNPEGSLIKMNVVHHVKGTNGSLRVSLNVFSELVTITPSRTYGITIPLKELHDTVEQLVDAKKSLEPSSCLR
jgi:hypothetical protein